jgi:hypothetical protein
MQALTLFNQNFAVTESLLQLFQVFGGLSAQELTEELRLAICANWEVPSSSVVHHACNDRVTVLARSVSPIPASLVMQGGLEFLLRQAVVVACTSLEAFFWDALRENALTVVQARRSGADETLKNIPLTIGDYMSISQYDNPDFRLRQLILKNFERGMLHSADRIEEIAKILTIPKFWEQVERRSGEPATNLKRHAGELINRRNQIAHRADRPDEGEAADGHGLRPISFAWANVRIQAARTLVSAAAEVIGEAVKRLESDIKVAREQVQVRELAGGGAARG